MTVITVYRKHCAKITIFVLLCISAYNVYSFNSSLHLAYSEFDNIKNTNIRLHHEKVENFYKFRMLSVESKLGAILFKRHPVPHQNHNENRIFTVLIWKHWEWLKKRHVYNFGVERENVDVLKDCSVNNCIFSGNNNLMYTADAVVVHLQRGLMPSVKNRNPKQRWIFLNDEAPENAFFMSKKKWTAEDLQNVFNWSMTYRSDADVPVPYGRTLPLDEPRNATEISLLIPNWQYKRRDVLATVLMSHCGVERRDKFLKKLRKYIKVDVYGKCSDRKKYKKRCPGHYKMDCEPMSQYLFYLVLENANCHQYLSEKVFYHAYTKGAIPVIWGPSREDLVTLLPPNSFLYADEHTNVEKLANHILTLAQNENQLLLLHAWRYNFKVVNEHGYFGTKSYHLCRLCEALNYNGEKEKIYDKLSLRWFLDPLVTCQESKIIKYYNEINKPCILG